MRSLVSCGLVALAAASGLQDNPVIGTSIQYLDGVSWTVTNGQTEIGAVVPGDLLTDLQRAGVIGDPLYELNFVPWGVTDVPVWDASRWNYSISFDLAPATASGGEVFLTFDGIKMAAEVYVNGAYLGYTSDQFLRYSYPVKSLLKATGNTLMISFPTSGDQRNIEGRWMACTGGWDWAPYTNTFGPGGSSSFTKGIWKSVYLVPAASTTLTHIVPHVFYNGSYPTAPLTDDANGPWTVNVTVHFNTIAQTSGRLSVSGDWGATGSVSVTLTPGQSIATVILTASNVKLWWPNGSGPQNLYNINVTFTPAANGGAPLADSRRVGFRVFTLVTADDSNPAAIAGLDGSGNFTMRFKVNGANIWSRGGNMIPTEELEGRLNSDVFVYLVKSAAAASFNTFRIWGGGIFLPDVFYDTADELGILMYHDLMSAQGGHSPANTTTQIAEVQHQIRRLSAHPSIAIWDGCNECNGHGIYAQFMTLVASEDSSRPPWPSCPSNGWITGVDRLWSLPNGSPSGFLPTESAPSYRESTIVERVSVVSAVPCGEGLNCTLMNNVDLAEGTLGPSPAATSAQECCEICANTTGCWAGVFYQGACWIKPSNATAMYASGRVAVWPAGNGPIPPMPPAPAHKLETHGPYQHGGGMPAVNGPAAFSTYSANIPPSLGSTGPLDVTTPGWYASEFGCSVYSSFESMAPTLAPEHWGILGGTQQDTCGSGFQSNCKGPNPMAQRNYPCLNTIATYFGNLSDWNATGEAAFRQQLYLCQLGQALEMKSDIEARRSQPEFGTIVWQYGEIWPTGGWGSIEYATAGFTPGQVLGGRWKPLQYFMQARLYKDVAAICGSDGRCFVKNDNALAGFSGKVVFSAVKLADGSATQLASVPVSLSAGAGAVQWTCMNGGDGNNSCSSPGTIVSGAGCSTDGSDCVVTAVVTDATANFVTDNFILLTTPASLKMPAATVTFQVDTPNADGSVPITVTSSATALYVHFTTLASGRFSDNSFAMLGASEMTVTFIAFGDLDYGLLASTLRVEHLQANMP